MATSRTGISKTVFSHRTRTPNRHSARTARWKTVVEGWAFQHDPKTKNTHRFNCAGISGWRRLGQWSWRGEISNMRQRQSILTYRLTQEPENSIFASDTDAESALTSLPSTRATSPAEMLDNPVTPRRPLITYTRCDREHYFAERVAREQEYVAREQERVAWEQLETLRGRRSPSLLPSSLASPPTILTRLHPRASAGRRAHHPRSCERVCAVSHSGFSLTDVP
jgi:hypothetical protein